MHQSKALSHYSDNNERCNCASHGLHTNSPERLTKAFNSCSPWHQRWLAAAPHFSAVFWMISLVWGSCNAPWKTIPPRCCQHVCSPRTRPWEWPLLIHSQYDWRLVGPIGWEPCSPPGYHIAVSSCWLLFSATWEGHRLVAVWSPWAPFTLTLSLSLSLSLRPPNAQLSAPTGHSTVDMWRGARGEMTSAFPLPVFPGVLYSPGSEAPLVLCVPLPEWESPDLTLLI